MREKRPILAGRLRFLPQFGEERSVVEFLNGACCEFQREYGPA